MPCAFCDSALPSGARYCPNCGTPSDGPDYGKPVSLLDHDVTFAIDTGRAATTSPAAILSLVFGITGWTVLPVLGAILAIAIGHQARREIRDSYGRVEGDGLAVAGLILGYAQVFLALIVVLVALAALAIFLGVRH